MTGPHFQQFYTTPPTKEGTTMNPEVPLLSIGSHTGKLGLPPDFPATNGARGSDWIRKGYEGQSAAWIVSQAALHKWEELAIWMPNGVVQGPKAFAWDSYATARKMAIGEPLAFAKWCMRLVDVGVKSIVAYVPPLPPLGSMHELRTLISPIMHAHARGVPITVVFDASGCIGHRGANKPRPEDQWMAYATCQYFRDIGIRVGCEPPGEVGTHWHEVAQYAWVTDRYLYGAEEKAGTINDRWTSDGWAGAGYSGVRQAYYHIPRLPTYVQFTGPQTLDDGTVVDRETERARWRTAGYRCLRNWYDWPAAMPAIGGGSQ